MDEVNVAADDFGEGVLGVVAGVAREELQVGVAHVQEYIAVGCQNPTRKVCRLVTAACRGASKTGQVVEIAKQDISNGNTRLTVPSLRKVCTDWDPLPCSPKAQRMTTPSDSRRRASDGDEFSSLNSRRRRSPRVTDSPRLRE